MSTATAVASPTQTRPARRRGTSRPVEGLVPCDWCRGTGTAPIDIAGTIRAQARGLDPLPTEMACPACRNAAGHSTGSRRPSDQRANPYVPDFVPASWVESTERVDLDPAPAPGPRWVDPTPYIREIRAQIHEVQVARSSRTR